MNMAWSLDQYEHLLKAICKSEYEATTIASFFRNKGQTKKILLRHDIDRFPYSALQMARLEAEYSITSTYYVRINSHTYKTKILDGISALGHEIGFHYETLSKCAGDIDKANALFCSQLALMRRRYEVNTCSAHGSPLSSWDNRSQMSNSLIHNAELLGDAYFSINYEKISYFTDTGRSWVAENTNFRDRVEGIALASDIKGFQDIIASISAAASPNYCIQTHPERWSYNNVTHVRSFLMDNVVNAIKRTLNYWR